MSSLYNISQDILDIFNNIENQDGEISEEQYNALVIKQDELKDKIGGYVKAIKEFESSAEFCKKEKVNINNRQNIYKNRVTRLKKYLLDAVNNFGECGKNNKYIETPEYRVFTRNAKVLEVDDKRVDKFIELFNELIVELISNGVPCTGADSDHIGIIDSINIQYKAYCELAKIEYIPFTIVDMNTIKVNISQTATISELLSQGDILNVYGNNTIKMRIEENTPSEDYKAAYNVYNEKETMPDNLKLTVAKVVQSNSLTIK